jgi:hypothetical protein
LNLNFEVASRHSVSFDLQLKMLADEAIQALESIRNEIDPRLSIPTRISRIAMQLHGSDPGLLRFIRPAYHILNQLPLSQRYIYKTMGVVRKHWSDTGLRDHKDRADILKAISLPREFWKQQMDIADAKVEDQLDNPILIDAQQIKNAWLQCSTSTHRFVRMIAVMLSTGSRVCEVLNHVQPQTVFERMEDCDDHVMITGVLKQNHFNLNFVRDEKEQMVFRRPMLFGDIDWLLDSLLFIRQNGCYSHTHINRSINDQTRDLFVNYPLVISNPHQRNITSHIFRKIYAQMAYKCFGSPLLPENVYVKRLFGHEKGGLPTYLSVRIVYPENFEFAV